MYGRLVLASGFAFLCLSPGLAAQQRNSQAPNRGTPQKYSIRGQVRSNENSQPVEMARVQLMAPEGEQIGVQFTRSNGEFEFNGLGNGAYRLVVDLDGYQELQERVEISDSPRSSVMLFLVRAQSQQKSEPGDSISAHELALPQNARDSRKKGGERLFVKADPKGSIPYFEKAIRIAPGYYEAYYDLGLAHFRNSDKEAAEQAFRKAIELSESKFAPAQQGLAALLCDRTEYVEAEMLARRSLETGGPSAQGHFELARALFGQNKVEEAEKEAFEARRILPELPEVNLLLANVHIRRKNYPALMIDLDTYLKLAPNGPMSSRMREMRQKVETALSQARNTQP